MRNFPHQAYLLYNCHVCEFTIAMFVNLPIAKFVNLQLPCLQYLSPSLETSLKRYRYKLVVSSRIALVV